MPEPIPTNRSAARRNVRNHRRTTEQPPVLERNRADVPVPARQAVRRRVEPPNQPQPPLARFFVALFWLLVAAAAVTVPFFIMQPIISKGTSQTGGDNVITFLCGIALFIGTPVALWKTGKAFGRASGKFQGVLTFAAVLIVATLGIGTGVYMAKRQDNNHPACRLFTMQDFTSVVGHQPHVVTHDRDLVVTNNDSSECDYGFGQDASDNISFIVSVGLACGKAAALNDWPPNGSRRFKSAFSGAYKRTNSPEEGWLWGAARTNSDQSEVDAGVYRAGVVARKNEKLLAKVLRTAYNAEKAKDACP